MATQEFDDQIVEKTAEYLEHIARADFMLFKGRLRRVLQALHDSASSSALEKAFDDKLSRGELIDRAAILSERSSKTLEEMFGVQR